MGKEVKNGKRGAQRRTSRNRKDEAKMGQREHLRPHQPLQSRYLCQSCAFLPSQPGSSHMTKKQLDVDVPRTVMFKEGVSGPILNDIVSFLLHQPKSHYHQSSAGTQNTGWTKT